MILFQLWQASTDDNFSDDDRLLGNILVGTRKSRLDFGDGIDDVHAVDDLSEDGVSETLRRRRREVEKRVVDEIDEELARRGIDYHRAGHRYRAALVLKPVHRLIADRLAGRLLVHRLGESAALDHESVDDTMENRAVVMAVFGVFHKIAHGLGRLYTTSFYSFSEAESLLPDSIDPRTGQESHN